ncbi:MAG TPA: MlaD family protein [Candidatus Binatia bacterium]|jgi:phospholipid/cholesterol/gamma-HCH transport system substrate-binding protein|nr:MlaD family protein [Candidatus Binatia bacterium]
MLSNEQRIGLFFLVGLGLLVAAIELTLGLGVLRDRYTLFADFRDVQGLDRGADVRLAGLRAGRVTDMRIDGDHVRVEMAIDGTYTVRRDAVAHLDFRALSGERFVALTLGSPSAPAAAPNDVILGETPASFAEAVDQLATVAESMNTLAETLTDDAGRLLVSLSDLVDENRTALGTVAERVASITEKLDEGTGTLGKLLNDPALYADVTATMTDVRQSVQDLGAVASNLREGHGMLGRMLSDDDGGLYAQVQETLDGLAVTAQNAQEITDGLRNGEGTLGKALADSTLYDQSLDTLRTAERAAQSVEDQAPISILGTIVTSLF